MVLYHWPTQMLNLQRTTALRLVTRCRCSFETRSLMQEVLWLEEVAQAAKLGSVRTGPFTFADRVFQNDIYMAIQETRQVMPCSNICPQQKRVHVNALQIFQAGKSA